MPSEGPASFAEFAHQFREGRVEPELGPPTAPRTADPAAEMKGMVSEIDTEPRLFDFVPREAPPTSVPSRRAPAERPHIGSVVYLLLVARRCRDHRRFLWHRLFPARTAQGQDLYRCRADVSRCGGSREHRKGYDARWRRADDNHRFRTDCPDAGSGIGLAKPRCAAATGGPESSRSGVRGAARRVDVPCKRR